RARVAAGVSSALRSWAREHSALTAPWRRRSLVRGEDHLADLLFLVFRRFALGFERRRFGLEIDEAIAHLAGLLDLAHVDVAAQLDDALRELFRFGRRARAARPRVGERLVGERRLLLDAREDLAKQ